MLGVLGPCGDQMAAQAVRDQRRGAVAFEDHLVEPRHPVAAARPEPVILLHPLVAMQ